MAYPDLQQPTETSTTNEVYAVTQGPMTQKMGLENTLRRVDPNINVSQVEKICQIAEGFPEILLKRLNPIISQYGPILALNPPIDERERKTTDLVIDLVNKKNSVVIILEPAQFDWKQSANIQLIQPLQLNRLWNEDNNYLGIGSRPIDSDPRGYIPIREQLNSIFRKFSGNIQSLTLVEDIIDTGDTIKQLLNIIRELGGNVKRIILTGVIYPARKQKLEEDFYNIEIISTGGIVAPGRKVVGGFNLVDCFIGGLGNTLGRYSKEEKEYLPTIVGLRTNRSPMPAGLFYGVPNTWLNFLKKTPRETQTDVLNAILEVNYELWCQIQRTLSKTIRLGDLQRFPLGLGVTPEEIDINIPVLDFIQLIINKNKKLSESEFLERLKRITNLVLDVDGTVAESGQISKQIMDLVERLKNGGVKIYINSLRSYNTFKIMDNNVGDWFWKNADGLFLENGALIIDKDGETILVRDREAIEKITSSIEGKIKEQNLGDIVRSPFPTKAANYFFVKTDDHLENYFRCKQYASLLQDQIELPDTVAIKPTGEGSIIITDPICDKGYPLKIIGLDPEQTMAIGNGLSDNPMFDTINDSGITIDVSQTKLNRGANYSTNKRNIEAATELLETLIMMKNL